jgi:iron complex outermembrane receptor protein
MDYEDLQVAQTKDSCNCNIIDNASNADIQGIEVEFNIAATDNLLLWLTGNWVDTEYVEFIDDEGNDNSGGFLQRTPDYQFSVGGEFTADLGSMDDALGIRVNYTQQGELFWAPTNAEKEDGYGLLDARISVAPLDAPWNVAIYGKNLTDEEYRNHVIPVLGDDISFFAPPRTYGVEFGYQF